MALKLFISVDVITLISESMLANTDFIVLDANILISPILLICGKRSILISVCVFVLPTCCINDVIYVAYLKR